MTRRALIVCPGRGSYGRGTLGILQDRSPAAAEVIDACDRWREVTGRPSVRNLDREPDFRGALHVAGQHASLLTFAASLADLAELSDEYEIVGACGNSMGWYTALAASGALPLDDAIRLVDTMGWYQADGVIGGQLMMPLVDETGARDPALRGAIEEALEHVRQAGAGAWWSIDLGSHAVLGADDAGLRSLAAALPTLERGERTFPIRLPLHSAFHTPLLEATAKRAQRELADLGLRAPSVPLIDGRGAIFRPRWADPADMRDYTLGHQVTRPYDFATGLRTALHHTAPDVVVLLGPGNSLGGPVSRLLVHEGWAGLASHSALDARQRHEPLLLSFGVGPQRARLVST